MYSECTTWLVTIESVSLLCCIHTYRADPIKISSFVCSDQAMFRVGELLRVSANNKDIPCKLLSRITRLPSASLLQCARPSLTLPVRRSVTLCRTRGYINSRFVRSAIRKQTSSSSPLPQSIGEIPPPSMQQLRSFFLITALPAVGFGFVDNVIMLVAGDAIDDQFGKLLQITTLAAAGLGNMISDVAGLFLSNTIEGMVGYTGIKPPRLSEEQLMLKSVRWTKLAASVIGISVGCLLGMAPLLFMEDREEKSIHMLFDYLDTDSNGRVTYDELTLHKKDDDHFLSQEQVATFLGLSPKDLDVGITLQEFQHLMSHDDHQSALDSMMSHLAKL